MLLYLFSILLINVQGVKYSKYPLTPLTSVMGGGRNIEAEINSFVTKSRTNCPDDRVKKGNVGLICFISYKIHRIITSKTETV